MGSIGGYFFDWVIYISQHHLLRRQSFAWHLCYKSGLHICVSLFLGFVFYILGVCVTTFLCYYYHVLILVSGPCRPSLPTFFLELKNVLSHAFCISKCIYKLAFKKPLSSFGWDYIKGIGHLWEEELISYDNILSNSKITYHSISVQFSSVAQSCLTLCDPMSRSTPGLPVYHKLPEFTQTHVHRVGDAIPPSHPLVVLFSSCPQSLLASGSFPMSQLFTWGGQSIGVSASVSVLPVNTQDWLL